MTGIIDDYLAVSNRSFDEVALEYDAITGVIAKSIVIISVPFFVPFVWLLNPSRRYYLIDHTVFALHAYCFVLAWPFIAGLLGNLTYILSGGFTMPQAMVSLLTFAPLAIYLVLSQRTMYGSGYGAAIVKGIGLFVGIAVSHFIYRFVQFWLVWWQVAV